MDDKQPTPCPVCGHLPPAPGFWPFLYDRVIVHWRTTVLGLSSCALVVVPCLAASGFHNKWVALTGALSIAITGAMSKH